MGIKFNQHFYLVPHFRKLFFFFPTNVSISNQRDISDPENSTLFLIRRGALKKPCCSFQTVGICLPLGVALCCAKYMKREEARTAFVQLWPKYLLLHDLCLRENPCPSALRPEGLRVQDICGRVEGDGPTVRHP